MLPSASGNRFKQEDRTLQPPRNRRKYASNLYTKPMGHWQGNKKEIPSASTDTKDIKLHQAENAWVPSCKQKEKVEGNPGDMEREKLKRNVQSVLNKITFQKFKILLAHLKRLNISTEPELALVVDLIYENAVHEPHFSAIYANLCKHLETIKILTAEKSEDRIDFATLLLTKCHMQFEEHWYSQDNKVDIVEEDGTEALPENGKVLRSQMLKNDLTVVEKPKAAACSNEEYNKKKRRWLGNIRFIGELFNLNMILKPVLQECIEILLTKQSEESLECLCVLIKTVGKELENNEGGSKKKETNEYFEQMQKIVDEHQTSIRIRFLIKDVLDLKNNNWIPRRAKNVPRTIDEIHKEAAMEARKQWQWYQNTMYIAAQSDKQSPAAAQSSHNTCLCEKEKPSTSKNRKKVTWDSKPSQTGTDTLDEAQRILMAQGQKGQQNSSKNKGKKKSSQKKPIQKKGSESSGSNTKL